MKNLNFQSSLQIIGIKLFPIKSRLLGIWLLLLFFTTNTSLYSQEESCECPQGYFNYNLAQGDVAISTIFPLTNIVYQLCFHVAGNLIIDKDFQFLNCNFYIEGAGSIKVRNSSKLGLLSCNLQGCDFLWEGIELEDNSSINTIYSSIKDARFAIYNEAGSGKNLVLAKNTLFRNNVIGIFSPPESGGLEIGPDFNGNTFESTRLLKGGLNDPSWPSTGDISYSGIVIQNSHFSIGKKNPLNSEINTFRNLINGISSWNNQVTIYGSEFINIKPSAEIFGQTIPEYYKNIGLITDGTAVFNGINTNGVGFANLVIEGFGKFGRNAFSNCVSGVVEKGGSCNVINSRMSSVDNGVILSNLTTNFLGANFTGSSISNNFLAYNVNGISVFNCANNLIEVDNNDLTASTISGNRGINLNGNMNCQLRVTANIIASYGISGIWVSFCPGSVLLNNVVSNYGGLISNNFGYFITDSPNSILSCNGANSPRLGNGDFGFFIRANDDIKMECNAVDGYGVGYQFPTSNMGTDFFTNSMQNCYTGLFIGRYAIIGPQENYGNVYNDNNFNIGAKHDGDNTFIGMSLFRVENTNTPDYPKGNTHISTPNGNIPWYETPGISRPICASNPNGCSPFPTRVTNQTDDFIATWPTVSDNRQLEARYYAQRYLYKKLHNDADYRNSNSTLSNFYNQNIYTDIGIFEPIEGLIASLYNATQQEVSTLQALYVSIQSTLAAIQNFDDSFGEITSSTSATDFMTRTAYRNQLNSLTSQVGTIWNTIKLRASSQASLLLTQNNLLSANLLVTQNEKIVNGIQINMIAQGRELPNSGEINTLQSIADQCAYIGGRGVLKARGILTMVSEQLQDDDIICGSSLVQPNVKNRTTYNKSIEIYPNPGIDHIQINWIDKDPVKSGRILNLDGLEVLNFKVFKDNNRISIDKLNSGTYILEITDNAKKIIEKIVKL